MSTASYLEAALVIDHRGDAVAHREFDRFMIRSRIVIEPVTLEQARIARELIETLVKAAIGRNPP